MINLLPNSIKEDIFFAHKNTRLLKWIVALSLSLVGVIIIVAGGYVYVQQTINSENRQLSASQQVLKDQKMEETQAKLEGISANTKLILQVLSREVLFSKLLRQLGASLPANTVLEQLQIDEVRGGVTLKASATDINAATQLQVNLQDSQNQIFEKADIESITCSDNQENKAYPCSVQIRALFSEKNSFTYITPGGNR